MTPSDEVCDLVDNDYNGLVDCGFGINVCGVGECMNVIESCVNGEISECIEGISRDELCDGVDNDCDGSTDEGFECITGDMKKCGSDIGECVSEIMMCLGSGVWEECEGAIGPTD
jgi:hypothetical protein